MDKTIPSRSALHPDYLTGVLTFILAGGKGDDQGINPLLPGDDDGVISVETTRLPGALDFGLVPVLHSKIVSDERAMQQTLACPLQKFSVTKAVTSLPDCATPCAMTPLSAQKITRPRLSSVTRGSPDMPAMRTTALSSLPRL